MNQILSTNMPNDNGKKNKNRNKGPIDTKNILKFFAIFLVVFGVLVIGGGAYSIYKNQSEKIEEVAKPKISLENKTDTTVLLKVMGENKNIAQVSYGWNDEEKTVVNGNNGKYLEQEIEIPSGINTLYIIATDEDGQEISYEKQYELESNIKLEVSGSNIKITYEGDKTISYLKYKWDEEEEKTIQINDTKVEEEIETLKGLHTLTVIVVDEDNNTERKVQKINGVAKPKVEIDIDDERKHYVISASDDTGLKKIEIRLNQDDGQKFLINIDGKKEVEYTLPMELQEGENLIEVKVYNSNDVTGESAAKFVI